jgi:lipoyl synthase
MRRHPDWLKRPVPDLHAIEGMEKMFDRRHLSTVCQSAHCPNLGECFNRGTATFMILGDQCTRNCRFCAVAHAQTPPWPDENEPEQVARAVCELGLRHVVITSVTRDDLCDGGAGQFVRTVAAIRKTCPESTIEILVPDFNGDLQVLEVVCNARPDVLNHNVETVPRLYPDIRPQAVYERSLAVLKYAAGVGLTTKSGLMLGLGETADELEQVFYDLVQASCKILTLGQYLAPSKTHAPVKRYVPPEQFDDLGELARQMGFKTVFSGPFVRSSYRADEIYQK